MIRTGEEYRNSINDGRDIWINGERVNDLCNHPQLRPIIDVRARIYDMQHEPETQDPMTYQESGERFAIGLRLPYESQDWQNKRDAVDLVTKDVGGVVTRMGDKTIGEMWSLWDGKDILTRLIRALPKTSNAIYIRRSKPTRFMSLPIPTQRETAQSGARSRPRYAGPCCQGNRWWDCYSRCKI